MSWAMIKMALNALLGTNDFKPLNKLMEERVDELDENKESVK